MVSGGGKWSLITAAFIAALLLTIGAAMAVPAAPTVHTRSQPDGLTFQVVQKGDERGAWLETLSGYTVTESNGRWYYGAKQGNAIVPTTYEVGKANPSLAGLQKHLKPNFPQAAPVSGPSMPPTGFITPSASQSPQSPGAPGSPQSSPSTQYASAPWYGNDDVIVITVNFTDNPRVNANVYTKGWYENLLFNQSNGGSMASYYNETSYDQYNLSGTVGSGWEDSAYNMAFYGAPGGLWSLLTCGQTADNCTYRLICEALDLADSSINFANYDKDSDGYIDHVIVVHAGQDQAATSNSNDIWSVRWSGLAGICPNQPWDGKDIDSGSILAEDSPMGTFGHEYGHDLGLPDLYDTDYSSDGIGKWGMMSFGSWLPGSSGTSPAHFMGWSRYRMGWINPVDITSSANLNNQTIAAIELYNYSSLYQHNISATEYFMIENRQKLGFDSYIPGDGILVWHIDESKWGGTENDQETDKLVDLEEADDNNELDSYGGSMGQTTDPFYSTLTGISYFTWPNSRAKSGAASGFSMTIVSVNGTNMTASLNDIDPPDIVLTFPTPANMSFLTINYTFVNASLDENATDAFLEWDNGTGKVNYTMPGSGMNWSINMTGLNDGVYKYAVWVNDSANNWNVSEFRDVYIASSLLIVINSPQNATYDVNWTDFNTTLSKGTDVVLFSVDGGANNTLQNNTVTFFFNVTYGNLSDGQHSATFWANDSTNSTQETVWFTVDTTAPRISFLAPTPANSTMVPQNYVAVNVSLSKPPASMMLEWNGTNESMSGSGTLWYANKTGLPKGNYTYRVYANDSQGRMNASEGRVVEVPLTCPVTITSDETLVMDMSHSSGTACVTFGADSITLDCAGHRITGNSASSTRGVYAKDRLGVTVKNCVIEYFDSGVEFNGTNSSRIENLTAMYNKVGLRMEYASDDVIENSTLANNNGSIWAVGAYIGNGMGHNLTSCNVSNNEFFGLDMMYTHGSTVSYSNISANKDEGVDLYNSTMNQFYGNTIDSHTVITGSQIGIKLSYTSNSNTFRNNTFIGNGEGINITPTGGDSIGNMLYWNIFSVNTILHAESVSGNEFNTTVGGVPQGNYWDEILTLSIYDLDGDGFGDSGPQYPYSQANGAIGVAANVVDWGPQGANVPPDLTIVSPLNTSYGPVVYFNVTISEAADWCAYSLDGQANVSMANDTAARTSYWAINTSMASGQHAVVFHCNDTNSYMNLTGPIYFTVDSSPPYFYGYIRSPQLPNEDQAVEVNVTVADALSNINAVVLEWNGTSNYTVAACSGSEYCFIIGTGNTTPHDNTTYVWYANDTAGNMNMSGQFEFIVDNQLPVASGITVVTNVTNNGTGGNLTGTWSFSDSDAGDNEAGNWTRWYVNGSEQASLENMTVILPGNTSKDDIWIFSVSVYDGYNWSAWVNSSGFTIFNTPPSAPTLSSPANDTNVSTMNVTFSFSSTDDDSDSLSYSLYISGAFNTSTSSTSAEVNFTDGYYIWYVVASDGQASSTQSATRQFRVDTAGPYVSSASVLPNPVLAGDNTSISASVSDVLTGVSSVWYNMSNSTWSSSYPMPLQSGTVYNRSINTSGMTEGSYNVTIYANDSIGNTRSVSAGELVISQISTVNITILDEGGNLTNTTRVTLLYSGTSDPFNQSSENVTGFWTSAAGGIWDLMIETVSFNITFQEVNTSGNITSNVTLDSNLTGLSGPSGVLTILNAIAASAGFSFTGVQISIPFNGSLLANPHRATVYKCPTWNFTSGSCPGGWINVTGNSTINMTTNTTTVNDASLSAFMIAESFWCGDGIVDSGEQCDDGNAASGDGCSSSCQTEVPAQPPSGGGGTSGGGGGAYVPPTENDTSNVTGICTANSRRCTGDALQVCKSDGSAWETLEACQHGCNPTIPSCVPGPGAVCTPGEKRCAGISVQQCSADGTMWETTERCERFCENGMCLEEAPSPIDILPWAAGIVLVAVIIGAAVFIRKKVPKMARKRVHVTPVLKHVPPLKERHEIPRPAPAPEPPPQPTKPKPEHLYPPAHATVRDIQLNPMKYVEKPVRISGRLSFSHRQATDTSRWHMFEDETGRMPAADHTIFSGKGELIAVVEETKTHQVYLRIVEFRKH